MAYESKKEGEYGPWSCLCTHHKPNEPHEPTSFFPFCL